MTSTIDPRRLFEWCRIPAEELENHPDARVRIRILDTPDDVHRWAETFVEELEAPREGRPEMVSHVKPIERAG